MIASQISELISRLGPAHVGLRPDLEIGRHVFQGIPSYIIRDPLTLQCHRVSLDEYEILIHLSSQRSLAETFDSLVSMEKLKPDDQDSFYNFVLMLHRLAFLKLPISDDKLLYRRFQAKQQARRNEKWLSLLFLRVPLLNPDAFLSKTVKWAKPLFSRWFFIVWLVSVLLCGILVIARRDELFAPLTQIFNTPNMVCMWVILIFLKVFHEFGHAYACKVRGGYVPEMGLYFIAFTPCAYVDVTSSWSFSRKQDRLIVGLAGVYAESILAVVGLLVWVVAEHSMMGAIAYKVFFLASIVTVFMNINPLMRFDGYYVLSDWLEIPNLRSKSRQFVIQWLKRIFLGIKTPAQTLTVSMKMILFIFGIAGSLYKTIVILSISALIATKIYLAGIVMAVFYIAITLFGLVRKMLLYLWKSPECRTARVRAIATTLVLLIGIPVILLYVPIPSYIHASGEIVKEKESIVRSSVDGFIREVSVDSGQTVHPETLLVKLENPQIQEEYLETQARLKSAQIELDAYRRNNMQPEAAMEQEKLATALMAQVKHCQEKASQLDVHAETEGIFMGRPLQKETGRFVCTGDVLGTILSGDWAVKILLDEQDMAEAQPRIGQPVDFRLASQPDSVLRGVVSQISPMGSHEVNMPVLTSLGQGDIMVNSFTNETLAPCYEVTIAFAQADVHNLRYGMTGKIRMPASAKSIGASIKQKVLRFMNHLNR